MAESLRNVPYEQPQWWLLEQEQYLSDQHDGRVTLNGSSFYDDDWDSHPEWCKCQRDSESREMK